MICCHLHWCCWWSVQSLQLTRFASHTSCLFLLVRCVPAHHTSFLVTLSEHLLIMLNTRRSFPVDDFGWYNIGWRNPEIRSPALDGLAKDGIILNRHYTFKYCSPTRSSLLSGRLPLHVNQNNECNLIESRSGIDLRMTLLPAKMKQAGYSTHMVSDAFYAGSERTKTCLLVSLFFFSSLGNETF